MELAQNAADAAVRVGTTTRLVLAVVDGELRAANTGAPLDAAGVAALASLRASAKRDEAGEPDTPATTGRFGVGFAAVLAVGDAPRVVTRHAGTEVGVAFDRSRTATTVRGLAEGRPALDRELGRRDDAVPALRLVWPTDPAEPPLPEGATTEVRVPLRRRADGPALLAAARAQAGDLLLALEGLQAVDVLGPEPATVERAAAEPVTPAVERLRIARTGAAGPGGETWLVARSSGRLPAEVLATLTVEDRARTAWSAAWALRVGPPAEVDADVLHAPTPTDERTSLPARLIASVPLDPDRRHVRPGPAGEHVLDAAAAHYPELVRALPPGARPELVPRPALPASAVDARLRDAVLTALRADRWLPAAGAGPGGRDLAPSRGVLLDLGRDADHRGLVRLVALLDDTGAVADLLDPAVADPRHAPALAAVGVTRLDAAGLADRLARQDRPPAWWHGLYDALGAAVGAAGARTRDELAALPVPLADGRTVLGPRGALVVAPGDDPGDGPGAGGPDREDPGAAVPGLRIVHPDAAHPLLVALGAREADAAALLEEPAVREAVERSVDDADAGLGVDALARCVLRWVAAAGPGVVTDGDDPDPDPPAGPAPLGTVLGALALSDSDGEHRRADELVLADGAVRALLDADAPLGVLDADVAAAHPREVLAAVGVLDGFGVLRDRAPAGPDHDLDDEEAWWEAEVDGAPDAAAGPPPELVAVRDLELIGADRWDAAWAVLAGDRRVREALRGPPGGPRPYTAWWLARHGRLGGRPPTAWRLPDGPHRLDDPARAGADLLAGLYDPVPARAAAGLDAAFLAAVGVRAGLEVVTPTDAADLLARLADPTRTVAPGTVAAAHRALVAAVRRGRIDVADVEPPARVRAADGTVRDAEPPDGPGPLVCDRPWRAAVLGPGDVLPADPGDARLLADLLDLPTDDECVHGEVRSPGTPTPWSAIPAVVAWAAALGREVPAGSVVLHEQLRVALVGDGRHGRAPDAFPADVFPAVWDTADALHADDPVRALLATYALPAADPSA